MGKSAILNYLCGESHFSLFFYSMPLVVYEELSDQEDNASYLPPFKQATQKVVDSGEHTTQGVDLRVLLSCRVDGRHSYHFF